MNYRDEKGRSFKVSLSDFEVMEDMLEEKDMYSSISFWTAPPGALSPTLLDAISIMDKGGHNPGTPGITWTYFKEAAFILTKRFNLTQIAAFFIHRFSYPCFEYSLYESLQTIHKNIAIGGFDI